MLNKRRSAVNHNVVNYKTTKCVSIAYLMLYFYVVLSKAVTPISNLNLCLNNLSKIQFSTNFDFVIKFNF